MSMPIIVLFVGVPGSGKTALSRALAHELHGVLLASDSMRIGMWGSREAIEYAHNVRDNRTYNNKLTFGALNYATEQIVAAGYSVVYDCNANSLAERAEKHDIAKNHDALSVVVRIKVPHNVSLDRIQTREDTHDQRQFSADKAEGVLAKFAAEIEEPDASEHVIEIPGDIAQEDQLQIFRQKLAEFTVS